MHRSECEDHRLGRRREHCANRTERQTAPHRVGRHCIGRLVVRACARVRAGGRKARRWIVTRSAQAAGDAVLYVVCHVERQVLWDMLCCMLYATWSGGCCGRRCTHAATWTHHPARPACVGTAGQGIMPSLQSAREAPPFAQHEHATLRVARHRRRPGARGNMQHATYNIQQARCARLPRRTARSSGRAKRRRMS